MKSPEFDAPAATAGVVTALRRYPVKSMQGETTNSATITMRGLLGDRFFALIDVETGKIASAKNPRKWPGLFGYSATFVTQPANGSAPKVQIVLPDGETVTTDQRDAATILSHRLGRAVSIASSVPDKPVLEEYWPDIEELPHRDDVTEEAMPPGTFFDCASVHVLTTASLKRFQELYPGGRWDVSRFRPNILVETGDDVAGFVENGWVGRTIQVGGAKLQITGGTPRCTMTTLQQGDLPADTNILRTAAQQNNAHVGVYATVVAPGEVRCGDAVRVG
jgi:uncharacterized protein YcbX